MPYMPQTVRLHRYVRATPPDVRAWYCRKPWTGDDGIRARQLRLHPLCQQCEANGLVVAGVDVDHIEPHRGNWELFVDASNLQTLCKKCHNTKTRSGL